MTDLIDRYRSYLANARGLASTTVHTYVGDVGRFLVWLDGEHTNVDGLDALLWGRYKFHLHQTGKRRTTVRRNLSSVRSFYRFLSSTGDFRQSLHVLRTERPLKIERRVPRWIGVAEADRLMNAASDDTPIGLRDRALLEMLYATGVRLAEVHAMNLGQVDRLKGNVKVLGKGRKERTVQYGAHADDAMHRYLADGRKQLTVNTREPALWLNRYGGRLSRQSIHDVVERYAERAGLSSGIRPHVLRHSYATAMLEGGADLWTISHQLGHEDPVTTQIYTHVTKAEARKAYLEHHPLARPERPRIVIRA